MIYERGIKDVNIYVWLLSMENSRKLTITCLLLLTDKNTASNLFWFSRRVCENESLPTQPEWNNHHLMLKQCIKEVIVTLIINKPRKLKTPCSLLSEKRIRWKKDKAFLTFFLHSVEPSLQSKLIAKFSHFAKFSFFLTETFCLLIKVTR